MPKQAVIVDCNTGWFSENRLSFTVPTLHSFCQNCIRKLPGQHCIKDQHCTEDINGIRVKITFYWPLAKRTRCSGRALASVIKSSHKKNFKCAIPSTRIVKIILARVKVKALTIRIFYKFLLYIKPRYNCCHLQKKIN